MSNYYLNKRHIITRMEELKADGIDFMSIKFGDEIPSIFCSYTK